MGKKKKIPSIVKEMKKYVHKVIDHSFQTNVSFSQYSMFSQCPKKWSLQYRDGHKLFTSNIHTVFGTAMHETTQHYLDVMYDKSAAEADRIPLIELFEENLKKEYNNQYQKNHNKHFSDSPEMNEFFNDGVAILKEFKKRRSLHFSKKGVYLVGCEIPLVLAPHHGSPNIIFQGFIDIVFYDEDTNKIKIIDIKTSTKSWGHFQKNDQTKKDQLLLYKHFFSTQFNFPIENIDVEFFILKRKIQEDSEWPQKRIQIFKPTAGRNVLKKAVGNLDNFINEAFTEGKYSSKEHEARPSKFGCNFCPFKDKPDLCSATLK